MFAGPLLKFLVNSAYGNAIFGNTPEAILNRPQPWHDLLLCVLTFFPFSRLYANSSSVDLSPNSLNLGSQMMASTSGAGSVTLTNHRNSPRSIFTVGDFNFRD